MLKKLCVKSCTRTGVWARSDCCQLAGHGRAWAQRDRTCTRSSLYGSSRSGSKRCEGACAIGETVPWLVSSRFIARHAKAWKLKKNYDVLQLEPRRFSWEIHLLLLWEQVELLLRGGKPRKETEFCCCWEETKNIEIFWLLCRKKSWDCLDC